MRNRILILSGLIFFICFYLYAEKENLTTERHPFGFNNFSLPEKVYEVTGLTQEKFLTQIEKVTVPQLLDLGVSCVRIHPDNIGSFTWDRIDPDKDGKDFDFSLQDELVRLAQSNGFEILPSLSPHSDWLNNSSYVPKNKEAYKKYIQATVERYDGDGKEDMPGLLYAIKFWQLDNEADLRNNQRLHQSFPNFQTPEDYFEVIKLTYEVMKLADEEAKLMPNLAGLGQDMGRRSINYLKKLMQLGALKYFDLYSTHIYPHSYHLKEVDDFLKEIQSLIGEKDIWITEIGILSQNIKSFVDEATLDMQARWLVKAHIYLLSEGIKKIYWLNLKDANPHLLQETAAKYSGLATFRGQRKPSYYTYKLMTEKLSGFSKIKKIEEGVYKFYFPAKNPVYVLWSEKENYVNLSSEISSKEVAITDTVVETDLTPKELVPVNKIPVSSSPIFVEVL